MGIDGASGETGMNRWHKDHTAFPVILRPGKQCSYKAGGGSCERPSYGEGHLCKLHTDLAWYKTQLIKA